jgi:catechol 2,3-dioxygenase-like lactoylglutathione lyase family enzyme
MIARLAHICFRSENADKMVAFYRDTLELKIKFTFKSDAGKDFGFYFDLGNRSFLEIFDNKGASEKWGGNYKKLVPPQGPSPYQHFCLEVQDIEGEVKKLRDKGLAVMDIKVGMDNSKQAWIKDPDGNAIELMEYTEKSLQVR